MEARRLITLAAGALLAAACAGDGAPAGDGATLSSVTYRFAWDDAGVSRNADGTWSVRDAAGHEVVVHEGRVSGYAVSLVPCEEEETSAVEASAAALVLPVWVGASVARAGHGETFDASVAFGVVEDLAAPSPREVTIDFPAARYCAAHWVVAPVDPEVAPTVTEASLWLRAEVIDDDGVRHPLELSTTLAYGALADLEGSRAGDAPVLTVERALGDLFADVDAIADDPEDVTWSVLRNLVRPARFTLSP